MSSETTTRFLVAAVGIPLAAGAVYAGGWVLAGVLAVLAVLSSLEYFQLAVARGARPMATVGAIGAAGFVALSAARPAAGPGAAGFGSAAVVLLLALAAASIWLRGPAEQPLVSVSTTFTGAVYAGATLSFGIFLRHLPGVDGALHGTALVFTPIAITWINDTAAYFVGRRFGRRKLIPSVSPGKTVAGSVGALVGSVAISIGAVFVLGLFPTYRPGYPEAIAFGIVLSIVAQVGDLVESLFKRDAAVKDSGRLLPGHGGALDRLDSLFYTLPLGYLFFRHIVGAGVPF